MNRWTGLVVVAVGLLCGVRARALPDLTPEVFDISLQTGSVSQGDVDEGCAGGTTGRRLLHYAIRSRNLGPDDLVMGSPQCPDCTSNPGAPCTNPLYVCGIAHGHAHFEGFARARLYDQNETLVAEGRKSGFCLLDGECATPQFTCGFQGITAGCADVYSAGLPCQYIDVTDVPLPDGVYTLRVEMDPDSTIAEANENNNTAEQQVFIGTPTPCPGNPSVDVPKVIPDQGSVASTVDVVATGEVNRVRVRLEGLHTYMGDVEVRLKSPLGTEVLLIDNVCTGDDDFDLVLDDLANAPIACPATGGQTYSPSHPLATFIGEPMAGTWTLTVTDTAQQDLGTLVAWTLELCGECGNGFLDPNEICDDANQADDDCCSSDCQTAAGDGFACDDGNVCTGNDACVAGTCVGATPITCDPCLTCEPALGCVPPTSLPCIGSAPGGSSLKVRHKAGRDTLAWRWTTSATLTLDEFGAPATNSSLAVCVYDQSGLKMSSTAPAGGTCSGQACWKPAGDGLRYLDRALDPDGLQRLLIHPGDPAKGRVTVTGRGPLLDLPALGWTPPVTVRVKRHDSPACWQAVFSDLSVNRSDRLKAKSDD